MISGPILGMDIINPIPVHLWLKPDQGWSTNSSFYYCFLLNWKCVSNGIFVLKKTKLRKKQFMISVRASSFVWSDLGLLFVCDPVSQLVLANLSSLPSKPVFNRPGPRFRIGSTPVQSRAFLNGPVQGWARFGLIVHTPLKVENDTYLARPAQFIENLSFPKSQRSVSFSSTAFTLALIFFTLPLFPSFSLSERNLTKKHKIPLKLNKPYLHTQISLFPPIFILNLSISSLIFSLIGFFPSK